MATIKQQLGEGNPYTEFITTVIDYFNTPTERPTNPFERLVMGILIADKIRTWGDDGGNDPLQSIGWDCCCQICGFPAGSLECHRIYKYNDCTCEACDDVAKVAGTLSNTNGVSMREDLITMAGAVGLPSPFATTVNKFKLELDAMITSGPNDYVYFTKIIDAYFDNVSFIDYFAIEYLAGTSIKTVLSMLGGEFRDGVYVDGLNITKTTDGEAGDIPVKDVTRVKMDATGFTEALLVEGPYVAIRVNPTEREIIWFGIGTAYIQPVVAPIGGVVDAYRKVTLAVSQNAAQNALNAKNQIEAFDIAGIDAPIVEGGDTVAISNSIAGPQTPTTFTSFVGLTGFDGTWLSSYQDGTGQVATTGESVVSILPGIDSSFENKYFEIYTSPTEMLVPWINLQSGGGVQPVVVPPPGVGVNYFETIMVDPGGIPIGTYAQQLADALTLAPGITATKTGVADATVVTGFVGSRTPTKYDNWDDAGKQIGAFVDGQDAGTNPGGAEIVEIDFTRALNNRLPGTWFKLGNLDKDHLFYYERAGIPVNPATLGVAYDFAHPIVIALSAGICNTGQKQCPPKSTCVEGECLYLNRYIQDQTDAAIQATGVFTVLRDPCCVYGDENCCNTSAVYTIADGDSIDPTPGTASVGDTYAVTQLIAPSGTVYPGTYVSDIDFINAYNAIVVPGELAKGIETPYLSAHGTLGCLVCVGEPCPTPCAGCTYIASGCETATQLYGFAPIILSTPYQANTDKLIFR